MEIVVCIKRVPDVSDADLEIAPDGRSIRSDGLVYGMGEWDAAAVEEAIRLKETHGGAVTVITVGDEDSEDVLRRALAMGADEALLILARGPEPPDAYQTARFLHDSIEKLPYDLVLTGSVSGDSGAGMVGGLLAGLLEIPQVALATSIGVDDRIARIQHEVEAGLERLVEVDLPALVAVQTGINEPRYVSIRGIRKVARVEIPSIEVNVDPAEAWVHVDELVLPQSDRRAEILEGPAEEVVDRLIDRLKENVGI